MKILLTLIFATINLLAIDYSTTPAGAAFIKKMHLKYGFSKSYIASVLKEAKHSSYALNRYNGTIKNGTDFSWARYKRKILIPESIELGKEFMKRYKTPLAKAKKIYGIDKEIITAFIRVESKFGLYGSEFRVVDVLTTLAFNPNRKQRFFKSELEKLFIVARRSRVNILNLRGSFAGAMGCVQQMPSIYLRYSVDLDNDGKKNPNSMADCIGSIAKFLQKNGWKNYKDTTIKPQVVGTNFKKLRSRVLSKYSVNTLTKYGIFPPYKSGSFYYIRLFNGKGYDIYLGDSNYRIITRYNHSKQYALSISLYAKALKD
jgi:membrane-bound lytic murein transglycosylase B